MRTGDKQHLRPSHRFNLLDKWALINNTWKHGKD